MPIYRASNNLAIEERRVLSQESALKSSAAGGASHTTYQYAVGPDGKRYIVGAEVSIIAPEEVLDAVPGGARSSKNAGVRISRNENPDVSKTPVSEKSEELNSEAATALEQIERDVIAHENAHKAAAGRFGGPAHYSYTTGPDGKRYITGGDVSVHTPATNDPEEALQNARQVMRAALAPGDPSGQDISVAASASAMASAARAQLSSDNASGDNTDGTAGIVITPGKKIADSYSKNFSPKGLWSAVSGYQTSGKTGDNRPSSILDIAA
jgi:hypothetical protein